MLYPVELWDQTIPHDPSASGTWLQRWARLVKLPTSWHKKRDCRAVPFLCLAMSNQLPVDIVEVLLPRFFLDFVLSSAAAAPFEQQPAALSLLQEAPLASAEAPDLLQHEPEAFLSLLQEAPLASAEAPDLLQHEPEAALDLSQEALSLLHDVLLASLAQVCSVLALLSAGASVDWADTVKAKNANAPRKRNFFMMLLSFIRRGFDWNVDTCKPRYELLQEVALSVSGFHYFCPPQESKRGFAQRIVLERWQSGNAAAC